MKVAGIDVHKKVLMVVVVDASTPEEKPARRRFVTMPSELHRLLTWLREQGVEEAVMESTAQYWRSVWLELEPHMRLHLAQAFSNRAPRGRKHDFKDAERLVRRLIADELILSFVPSGAVMRLAEVPGLGVDSAQQIIAEVGAQAGTFASAAELTLWVEPVLARRKARNRTIAVAPRKAINTCAGC